MLRANRRFVDDEAFTTYQNSDDHTKNIPASRKNIAAISTTAESTVYTRVLRYAGARPTDRDSVDKRIVASVRNRNGQIINCVAPNGTTRCSKNAGGWPKYGKNNRKLTLPSNQSSIASNGYSNLENWLNSMDRSMNGAVQSSSPASPAALSVL